MNIKPIEKCPQCGGEIEARTGVGKSTWMACKVCGARGPSVFGDTELAAVAWARKIQVEVKVLSPREQSVNWRQGPKFSTPLYLGGQQTGKTSATELLSALYIMGRMLWRACFANVPIAVKRVAWMRKIAVGDIVIEITQPRLSVDAEESLGRLIKLDEDRDDIVIANLLSGKETHWHNAEFVRIPITESGEFVDSWP